jgi:hypothetical protein
MLSRIVICRQHAAECDRRANLVVNVRVREIYRELAIVWRGMAADIESINNIKRQSNQVLRFGHQPA